jgi:hypothetical protein
MGLFKRTLPNQKTAPGFLLYFLIFVGVFIVGYLLIHRNDIDRKQEIPKEEPKPVLVDVQDVVQSGQNVAPLPVKKADVPEEAVSPLNVSDRGEGGVEVVKPTAEPKTPKEEPTASVDVLDFAKNRTSPPASGGDSGKGDPLVDFGGVQVPSSGDPGPSLGGNQPARPAPAGASSGQGAVVFGATRLAQQGQKQSGEGRPQTTEIVMTFPTPTEKKVAAAKAATASKAVAVQTVRSGFDTGNYLPAGYRIHVSFVRGFQTFSGENTVTMVIDQPVKFLGKTLIPAGLRVLGTSQGNDFFRNRVQIRSQSLQYPHGEKSSLPGILKGEDDAIGIPAYFQDAPMNGLLIPFINALITEYLDNVKQTRLAIIQQLARETIQATALGGSAQPQTSYDPKVSLINATAEALQKHIEARNAYYTRLYQPYFEIKRGMTGWIELSADTDLTFRPIGSNLAVNTTRVTGTEMDGLPSGGKPPSPRDMPEPAPTQTPSVSYKAPDGVPVITTNGGQSPSPGMSTTGVLLKDTYDTTSPVSRNTPRSTTQTSQPADPIGDILGTTGNKP